MADYDVLTLDEQTDLLVGTASALLPDKNFARNSDNWKRQRVTAMATTDTHAHIASAARDVLPDTARGAKLDRWGAILQLPRKGATGASADEAGKIRGADGSSWGTTDILVHKSGKTFRPTTSGTLDSSGEALVGIVAIDTGPTTRLAAGDVLSWQTAPDGLEEEVELQVALDTGGALAEDDGPYRTRILNRTAQPAQGGNVNDWRQWAIESSDAIAEAYVYPNRSGVGSVDVAALKAGRGSARLMDAGERTALLVALDLKRPVSAEARVLEVVVEALDIEVAILPESELRYARDWNDATPAEVLLWTDGTRTLQLATARPASMAVGDRIVVEATSGVEMVIESLVSTDSVVLVSSKGQTPAVGSLVYSGGAVIAPARDALLALFDSLGPRKGASGASYWEGIFRMSKAFEAVQTAAGVLDSEWITPTANVEPEPEVYPDDDTVALLVPGSVVVRYL